MYQKAHKISIKIIYSWNGVKVPLVSGPALRVLSLRKLLLFVRMSPEPRKIRLPGAGEEINRLPFTAGFF
jgi:hypothetical protein